MSIQNTRASPQGSRLTVRVDFFQMLERGYNTVLQSQDGSHDTGNTTGGLTMAHV